jgi:hypothetical protein
MENFTVKNSDILHDPMLLIKSGDLSTQLHAILCKNLGIYQPNYMQSYAKKN